MVATISKSSTPHLSALQRDGYVVIRNLLTPNLLLALQATCKYLTSSARAGQWPHVRTVPKQYPPWPPFRAGDNIWGIQHLLHPDMKDRDVFAEVYFSDAVLDVVKELVGLSPTSAHDDDDRLVMELFNLLVSPAQNQDFELCWHRDDVRPDVDAAEERRLLAEKSPGNRQLHAQYNIALFEDASLVVVPGSHARVRTEGEKGADPFAAELPGQLVVELEPGDAVFYNSNILHRGIYKGIDAESEEGRMTLHGSVGLAGYGNERARQVLQHAVGKWVDRAHFSNLEGEKRERAEAMRNRLVAMGTGDGLGYSLQG